MNASAARLSDHAGGQQRPSPPAKGPLPAPAVVTPALYRHPWPPVRRFGEPDPELDEFIARPAEEQRGALAALRGSHDGQGRFLHAHLSALYADSLGYADCPFAACPDDAAEVARFRARVELERELLDHWLAPSPAPELDDQLALADHLDHLAATNPGVDHPLFDYLRDRASPSQLRLFLHNELIRNEVVDDEVALLVVGLQGMQKAVAAANLWDECGRGRLANFHTYWLRRMLEATDGWADLHEYRPRQPWFAKITSNLFFALLTRPSRKFMAYGCFLVFESWVEPHFRSILEGMSRVGLTSDDVRIYFAAHVAIDPRHSRELSDALRLQRPPLVGQELHDVAAGAQLAAAAGVRQFDHMLDYLRSHTG